MLTEQIAVTLTVVEALDDIGVPYAIGGSFASALHGVMRATMDADLVADLRLEHIEPLAQALGDAFYADVEMMRGAVRCHGSFNLIHLDTMFKVDVFVAKPRSFDRSQLARRQLVQLSEEPERHRDRDVAKATGKGHAHRTSPRPVPGTSNGRDWNPVVWCQRMQ